MIFSEKLQQTDPINNFIFYFISKDRARLSQTSYIKQKQKQNWLRELAGSLIVTSTNLLPILKKVKPMLTGLTYGTKLEKVLPEAPRLPCVEWHSHRLTSPKAC